MTFSKQIFLLFFILPLQHASNPKNCSSSFSRPLRCGSLLEEVPIRFPFCDHEGFNLHCNHLNKTTLELPMSGTFLVRDIDYKKQQISIKDPENCMAKRLLTFNISGSPFSPRFQMFYTFLSCPNKALLPLWYPSIYCLSNSTSTFSGYINNQNLLLEWDSPDCRGYERDYLRCGFNNKASLQVKCFGAKKPGHLSRGLVILIIILSVVGAVTLFATCITIRIYNSRRFVSPRRRNENVAAANQPREIMATRGLDHSTIESYKKVELGESRRLPGTNGIVCPICLSEYMSKETVRFIPECDHCFHVECIDPWLKIHGSCPLCRNSASLKTESSVNWQ